MPLPSAGLFSMQRAKGRKRTRACDGWRQEAIEARGWQVARGKQIKAGGIPYWSPLGGKGFTPGTLFYVVFSLFDARAPTPTNQVKQG